MSSMQQECWLLSIGCLGGELVHFQALCYGILQWPLLRDTNLHAVFNHTIELLNLSVISGVMYKRKGALHFSFTQKSSSFLETNNGPGSLTNSSGYPSQLNTAHDDAHDAHAHTALSAM